MKRRYHFHVWYEFNQEGKKGFGRTYMTGSTKVFSPPNLVKGEKMIAEAFGINDVVITDYKLVAS